MLSRLEIDHLVKIAWNCGIVCGTHSKRQLTRAIQDNFRRPEFLRHILQRWNEQERATLAYLLLAPEASEEERPHRGFPFWNEDGWRIKTTIANSGKIAKPSGRMDFCFPSTGAIATNPTGPSPKIFARPWKRWS
jgi:hypothetical protein